MFKKIISIITVENPKELKLVSFSIDFAKALIETLKTILQKIRTVLVSLFFINIVKLIKKEMRPYF